MVRTGILLQPFRASAPSRRPCFRCHHARQWTTQPAGHPLYHRRTLSTAPPPARHDDNKPAPEPAPRQPRLAALHAHENIYTLPNLLTLTRLLAAPATGYLVLHDMPAAAFALFAYAGATDVADGALARRWRQQTVVGSVIDPMADKALVMALVVSLTLQGALPPWLATLLLGRDAAFGVAAIYYRYASLPPPKTWMRYWDFSLPSARVHPTAVSKLNTFLQLVLVGATLALPLVLPSSSSDRPDPAVANTAEPTAVRGQEDGAAPARLLGGLATEGQVRTGIAALQAVVAATTVASGLSYVVKRDAVTILGTDEALKRRQGLRGRAILGAGFGSIVLAAAVLGAREMDGGSVRQGGEEDERANS